MEKVSDQKPKGAMRRVSNAEDCHMCRLLGMYTEKPVCTRCGSAITV